MDNSYQHQLDELLKENLLSVREREKNSFESTLQKIKAKGIILFGSGGFGKRTCEGLRKVGIEPLGFCDNNTKIWNNQIGGLTVYSPEEATRRFPEAVFMITIWSDVIGHPFEEVSATLHSFHKVDVQSFFFLYWKFPEAFLPYFSIDLPHKTLQQSDQIKECFHLFEDELSQKEFVAQIKWRLSGDFRDLTPPSPFAQYFSNDLFKLNQQDVFVDCGAFDGDTLKSFLKNQGESFSKYFAFEPDPINFNKLKTFAASQPEAIRNKITAEPYGVSNEKKRLRFAADGSLQSSASDSGNVIVDCIALDAYLPDESVTYIKMDTEGAEPDILEGAAHIIKTRNPILAVSVYHQFDHLWLLPLRMKQLNDSYTFFLRPHCQASWDLIVYGIPRNRLILPTSK